MKQSITFANGQTLSVGDTFYFVHPEMHDGSITECHVDSFWPAVEHYGDCIRHTTTERPSQWHFVYKQFFERENPTCFVNYDDAKKQADSQRYSPWAIRVEGEN